MPLSLKLILLAGALGALGVQHGSTWWPAIWLALDFFVVGVAEYSGWHRIFGKRAEGSLPAWSWIVFGPFLVYTHAIWHLLRIVQREAAWHEVTAGITIGRRLQSGESPGNFENWIDLTAEFSEPRPWRGSPGYLSLAILDGSALEPRQLLSALQQLRPGSVFIHCAQGHGRTGLVCAALLLYRRVVSTPDEAIAQMKAIRPGVRLNNSQRRALDQFAAQLPPA
jgi:Tyrosine phosphatase family